MQTVAVPAFQRLDTFFRKVYLPTSRDTIGIYDTPDGDQYYRNRIRYLHHHREPGCDAHPQPRPRGSEAHPRRDGEDARRHQLPRHARSVPGLHPQRSALLLQDAGRVDGRVREDRARHRAAAAEAVRPPAEDGFRHPRDSRRERADHDHGLLPAAVTRRLAARQFLRESLQARDAADVGNRGAHGARGRARPSPADRAVVRAARDCRNSAAMRATRHSSRVGRCTGEPRLRARPLQGRLLEVRPAELRHVARGAPGGRHRHAPASSGRATRLSTTSSRTPARTTRTSKTKSTATSPGRARRWRTS